MSGVVTAFKEKEVTVGAVFMLEIQSVRVVMDRCRLHLCQAVVLVQFGEYLWFS